MERKRRRRENIKIVKLWRRERKKQQEIGLA